MKMPDIGSASGASRRASASGGAEVSAWGRESSRGIGGNALQPNRLAKMEPDRVMQERERAVGPLMSGTEALEKVLGPGVSGQPKPEVRVSGGGGFGLR